ncbi:hypothetical protein [Dactylosporangium sp. NPDC049140]|uniref:hypothetical protein n=1 Tax=Dactylosporangium sp. NPDC049140 TaxID=3155647 RepID=UPI0033DF5873
MTEPSPRWVRVFAIAGGVIVVLVVVALLAGHGPGRHMHHGMPHPVPAVGGPGW